MPSDDVVEKFKKLFGFEIVRENPRIGASKDRICGIALEPITLSDGDKFLEVNTLSYRGRVKFILSKLSKKEFYEVFGVVYEGEYLVPLVKLLKTRRFQWLDVWFATLSSSGAPMLMLGNGRGLVMLAPYRDQSLKTIVKAIDIYKVAVVEPYDIREIPEPEPEPIHETELRMPVINERNLERMVEIWSRELGIIV